MTTSARITQKSPHNARRVTPSFTSRELKLIKRPTSLACSKVRDELSLEDRLHSLNALDLDDDEIFDDEIDAILTEQPALVIGRQPDLMLVPHSRAVELDPQGCLVGTL